MKSLNKQTTQEVGATKSGGDYADVSLLILTMADTSWRIFAPVLVAVGLGIKLDLSFSSKPLITLGSLVLGAILAALLVTKQLKRIEGSK